LTLRVLPAKQHRIEKRAPFTRSAPTAALLNTISRTPSPRLIPTRCSKIAEQLEDGLNYDHIGIAFWTTPRAKSYQAEAGRRRGALGQRISSALASSPVERNGRMASIVPPPQRIMR